MKTAKKILKDNADLFQEHPFEEMYHKDKDAILKCMEEYAKQFQSEGLPEITDEEIEKEFPTDYEIEPNGYIVIENKLKQKGIKWYRTRQREGKGGKKDEFIADHLKIFETVFSGLNGENGCYHFPELKKLVLLCMESVKLNRK